MSAEQPGAVLPPASVARLALACLDLTTLGEADQADDVLRLCERAQGPFGRVAAVCVWPRFAALARARLPPSIAVAAVANFPAGDSDVERALRDVGSIRDAGAQEVDLVLPYRSLLQGDEAAARRLVEAVRAACPSLVLKVILETGVLGSASWIQAASRLALACGADFLKTSTGKVPVGATPVAAREMLQVIASDPHARQAGFKASGGVRTLTDAAIYLGLVQMTLGPQAVVPARCRIGASGLLNEIEAQLGPMA